MENSRTLLLVPLYVVATILLPPRMDAFGQEPNRPLKPQIELVLFHSDDRVVAERSSEFIVKVENSGGAPFDVLFRRDRTHVLDSRLRVAEPFDGWHLRLVVKIEGDVPIMDFSGRVDAPESVHIPVDGHELILFRTASRFLPGERLRLWAELKSPEGDVYLSNEVQLQRVRK